MYTVEISSRKKLFFFALNLRTKILKQELLREYSEILCKFVQSIFISAEFLCEISRRYSAKTRIHFNKC